MVKGQRAAGRGGVARPKSAAIPHTIPRKPIRAYRADEPCPYPRHVVAKTSLHRNSLYIKEMW